MDRLRRSIRQSFRRRSPKESSDDPSKPHQWQKDEASVRAGTCSFTVKYLGCVEVYESRGMQVCEEALKVLRNSRRRTIKGVLYVSGDGLRVVDAENKGLIVDQTIEKVSFCAPDRNQEKGFAYICRDGTTRRWMCHGFIASKDSGERLSHAVGCAFAVCLEQKQKRDREAQIIAQIQPAAIPTAAQQPASQVQSNASTIAETTSLHGSFRRASLQERKQDPQNIIHTEKPPVKPVSNPNSISRPAPNKSLFERQGSLRMPATTVESTKQDSFHRFNSLRLNQLPSNLTRQQQQPPQHSSNNAGVGAIWEGEETSSITDLSTTASISGRATNGFDSPSHSTNNAAGHLSRWDKSFVQGSTNLNNESSLSPASSTISTTSKSKAEEWLQVAANQARLLQQQNRQTPPNSNAASSSFNSSPAPGGGDSSTSSPQHYAAYCNAIDFYPSTPAHQSSTQRPPLYHGGQNGTDSTTAAYHGPPPLNANRSVSSSVAAAGWHQSVSFDVADADNFEDKWASLDKRRNSTSNSNVTNPFAQESTTVQI